MGEFFTFLASFFGRDPLETLASVLGILALAVFIGTTIVLPRHFDLDLPVSMALGLVAALIPGSASAWCWRNRSG